MGERAPSAIDVDRLVEDLKERLERERATGAYEDDLSRVELAVLQTAARSPYRKPTPVSLPRASGFRPELGLSSKPVIAVITFVKKFFLRLLFYVFDDLARQMYAVVLRLEASLEALYPRLDAEAKARERAELDIQSVSWRVDGTEAEFARIPYRERAARGDRLQAERAHLRLPGLRRSGPEAVLLVA